MGNASSDNVDMGSNLQFGSPCWSIYQPNRCLALQNCASSGSRPSEAAPGGGRALKHEMLLPLINELAQTAEPAFVPISRGSASSLLFTVEGRTHWMVAACAPPERVLPTPP